MWMLYVLWQVGSPKLVNYQEKNLYDYLNSTGCVQSTAQAEQYPCMVGDGNLYFSQVSLSDATLCHIPHNFQCPLNPSVCRGSSWGSSPALYVIKYGPSKTFFKRCIVVQLCFGRLTYERMFWPDGRRQGKQNPEHGAFSLALRNQESPKTWKKTWSCLCLLWCDWFSKLSRDSAKAEI